MKKADFALKISGLKKEYATGVKALKGIDLEIEKGDFYALLGANGAGKTTIIGIVTGIVNKTEGKVWVNGIDIDLDHDAAKALIGVVPQEFNFSIFEKVWDILIQQAGFFGIPRKEAESRVEQILKDMELWEKRDQPSRALSGGMKRRLMIARALVHDPEILILDEPTAGVDVELRRGMWDYLKNLNQQGKTILLTTHYLEEVEELCKKVSIIKEGLIFQRGTVNDLIKTLDSKVYLVSGDADSGFSGNKFTKVDEQTVEILLQKNEDLVEKLQELKQAGWKIEDVRPKGNRLEQLFLNILKK